MADDTSTDAKPDAETQTVKKVETTEQTVPYERFQQVNSLAQDAKKQNEELQRRLQELEDKDKSELERERTQRERLQAELQDRDARLVSVERGSWVRDAANAANFVDPGDAVALVDLSAVDSESAARQAVKKIAESKKHLVRVESERPEIGRVLADGKRVERAPDGSEPSEEEEQFLADLKAESKRGWTSTRGLLD